MLVDVPSGAGADGCRRVNFSFVWFMLAFLVGMAVYPADLQASSVTLAWDASTSPGVAGYRLYYGAASATYTNVTDARNTTNTTVAGLISGVTYYFAVTAYDLNGLESVYSTEISYTPAATVAPTVALTSPQAGATYNAPANILLSANVVTNGHTIAKVQFFNGTTLLGESLAPPYSWTWSGVAAGAYSLNAAVVYDASLTVKSTSVSVSVQAPTTAPTIAITSPVNNAGFAAPASFSVAASVNANGHSITKVQFYNGAVLAGEDSIAPYACTVTNLGAGNFTFVATALYDGGSAVSSPGINVVVTNAAPNTPASLPAPWQSVDIGGPAAAGTASIAAGVYSVSGAGNLGGTADQLRFLFQPMTGKGEIRAQVTSEPDTGTGTLAGIMIRETLAAGSEYVFIGVAPNGAVSAQSRTVTSAAASAVSAAGAVPPRAWVRLLRSGSTVYAYTSNDGASWQLIKATKLSLASNVYFGFAVCSGSATVLNTSTFGNATIIP